MTEWPSVAIAATLLLLTTKGADASRVDLVSTEDRAVSVPLGTEDGVTAKSDFEVLSPDGSVVGVLYPAELYTDRFWSQTLSPDTLREIVPGGTVRSAEIDPALHRLVRREGAAELKLLHAAWEEQRIARLRSSLAQERERRREVLSERDRLDSRLDLAEDRLLEAEDRWETVTLDEEEDLDRLWESLESLAGEREELQSRRERLLRQGNATETEFRELTTRVERLADKIDRLRRQISKSRSRMRSAREEFLEQRREWRRLVSERASLDRSLDSLDQRIKVLAEEL